MKLRTLLLFLLPLSYAATAATTAKISTYQAADSVMGQSTFTSSTPGLTAARMSAPRSVAVDPTTGKVFVADRTNNRVLRFSSAAALASGANAELVLGQTAFGQNGFSGTTATTMLSPGAVAFDGSGDLFVADTGLNRVLRFNSASGIITNGAAANAVFGQANFTTSTATIAAAGMHSPSSLAVGSGYLWVADSGNNRVIGIPNPQSATTGASATRVFGQTALNTNTAPAPTASSMNSPEGVAIGSNFLWVSDTGNNRVLRFSAVSAAANGDPADRVLGQPNMTSNSTPSSATAANLYSPEGLALDESDATGTSLWVADRVQNRVVRYDDVNSANLVNGADAVVALGQANLVDSNSNTTRRGLDFPYGVAVDTFTTTDSPLTIWVADADNNRVLRFKPAVPAVPKPAPPTIAGSTKYKTKKSKVTVSGSASAAAGLVRVEYKGGKGGFRSASGTSHWSFKAKCKPGKNRFTVLAVDALGRTSAPLTIVIKRS